MSESIVAAPLVDTACGNRNLVEFALRLEDGESFNPPRGADDPDRAAVDAAVGFLRQQAANYFETVLQLRKDADIQDCCQHTILRIWRLLARQNSPIVRKPRAYFIQIMNNVATEYWKRTASGPSLCAPEDLTAYPVKDNQSEIPSEVEAFCSYLESCQATRLVETFLAFWQTGGDHRATREMLEICSRTLSNHLREIREYAEKYRQSLT